MPSRTLAIFALCAVALLGADDPKPAARGLDIYFIDVDGGAATLLVTPEGKSVLIDSGWPGKEDRDPKRIVHVLKNVAKLDKLDHVVTTHWHMDHFGGVEGLSKLVPIGQFWDRGLPEDKIDGLDFPDGPKADDPMGIAYRKASAGKRTALKVGHNLRLGGVDSLVLTSGGKVIDFTTRYPGRALRDLPANPACESAPADLPVDGSDNARSLTILFTLGDFAFLDCGDLTWNVEKKLVCPADLIGQVDLFQVTHHGMDISNHPTLVKTIAPTVAVMDNGPKKGGAAATVKLLKAQPSLKALYALHKNATTGPDDNASPDLIANRDPAGGEFIKVSVAPDGKTYTVQIGADGAKKAFESR
jgi:competence protein ComEC